MKEVKASTTDVAPCIEERKMKSNFVSQLLHTTVHVQVFYELMGGIIIPTCLVWDLVSSLTIILLLDHYKW